MIRTIVFDLGNVLIDWNPRYLYRKLFDNEADIEHFLDTVCTGPWNAQMDRGKPFAEAVAELSAAQPDKAHLVRAWHDRWIETIGGPITPTVDLLERLHDDGRHLVALTNWSAETFPLVRHARAYSFLDRFEKIFVSGELRMVKPNDDIFLHLLEECDRAAGDCFFIDDSAANIDTADRLGFQTHHFTSADRLEDDLRRRGLLD